MGKLSPGALSDLTKAAGRSGDRVRAGFQAPLALGPGPCAAGVGSWGPWRAVRLLEAEGAPPRFALRCQWGSQPKARKGSEGRVSFCLDTLI